MFRGQLVAANLVPRHPAEVDVPSRGRDVACRRAHDTGLRADEPALGGDDGSFGEKARRLKTPIRKRVPEHAEEAQDLLAALHRPVRGDEVGVVAPRTGVRIPCVERLDMPFYDALGISHQAVPPLDCGARILALRRAFGQSAARAATGMRFRVKARARLSEIRTSSASGPVWSVGDRRLEDDERDLALGAFLVVPVAAVE